MKYDHKIVEVHESVDFDEALQNVLLTDPENGWELAGVVGRQIILKRPATGLSVETDTKIKDFVQDLECFLMEKSHQYQANICLIMHVLTEMLAKVSLRHMRVGEPILEQEEFNPENN